MVKGSKEEKEDTSLRLRVSAVKKQFLKTVLYPQLKTYNVKRTTYNSSLLIRLYPILLRIRSSRFPRIQRFSFIESVSKAEGSYP